LKYSSSLPWNTEWANAIKMPRLIAHRCFANSPPQQITYLATAKMKNYILMDGGRTGLQPANFENRPVETLIVTNEVLRIFNFFS
jgi:hypothetical protein